MTRPPLAAICFVLLSARVVLAQAAPPPPDAVQSPAEAPAPAAQPATAAPPQPPPAAAVAPATPPAQAYGPQPDPWMQRRSLLEAELRQLEEQRGELSLGMPITLLVVGGGAFVIGGFIVMIAAMSDAVCDGYDSDYDTYDDDCEGPDDSVYVVGAGAMLAGGVAAIVGLVTLIDRAGERRPLGRRIKEIRRELQARPMYGFQLEPGGGRATVALRF